MVCCVLFCCVLLKTESCHDCNFVIIGGTAVCCDQLRLCQWCRSWNKDNSLFSVHIPQDMHSMCFGLVASLSVLSGFIGKFPIFFRVASVAMGHSSCKEHIKNPLQNFEIYFWHWWPCMVSGLFTTESIGLFPVGMTICDLYNIDWRDNSQSPISPSVAQWSAHQKK